MAGKGGRSGHWQGAPKAKWEKRLARMDERLDKLESKGAGVFSAIAGPTIGIYQWIVPVTLGLRVLLLLAAGALMWVAILNLKALSARKRLALLTVWPCIALLITWWSVQNSPFIPRYSDRQTVVVSGRDMGRGRSLNLNNAGTLIAMTPASTSRVAFRLQQGTSLQTSNIPEPFGIGDFAVMSFGDDEWVFGGGNPTTHVIRVSRPTGSLETLLDRFGMWPNRSFKVTLNDVNDKTTAAPGGLHIEYSFIVEER